MPNMQEKKWNTDNVKALFELPFNELLFQAQTIHRQHFKTDEIELCALLSIKTGTCPEDCAYCPQSGHYETDIEREKLLDMTEVLKKATLAKESGATRFCMGAAWRNPPKKALPRVIEMIKAVKNLGLETCVTLGMLDEDQAQQLHEAGLDYYNHNLDTSPDYYKKIITTRTYQDRLDTLQHVRAAGINVCCGAIIGMGETRADRIELLLQLANLPALPKSVPINRLIPIKGTPLEKTPIIDNIEFIRTIATTRIVMPISVIRLSAGRDTMSEEMHILCYMAGANSIFYGDTLLTATNPESDKDLALFKKLGMTPKTLSESVC
jgi:biotin synthase